MKIKRPEISAADLLGKLAKDKAFVEAQAEKQAHYDERLSRIAAEMAVLQAELDDIGSLFGIPNLSLGRVGELDMRGIEAVVPVLVRHLKLPYSDAIKESIARALARRLPNIKDLWNTLLNEYMNAPTGLGFKVRGDTEAFRLSAKDGLACALAENATSDRIPVVIELIEDPLNGESRLLLLPALLKSSREDAKRCLEVLAKDPVFEKELNARNRRRKSNSL